MSYFFSSPRKEAGKRPIPDGGVAFYVEGGTAAVRAAACKRFREQYQKSLSSQYVCEVYGNSAWIFLSGEINVAGTKAESWIRDLAIEQGNFKILKQSNEESAVHMVMAQLV